MTALLIDEFVALGAPVPALVPVPARVWRARSASAPLALVPGQAPAPTLTWAQRPSASPQALAPARPEKGPTPAVAAALPERLYWTQRGLALVLGLIALVVGLMVATLVTGFLAVTNEPVGEPGRSAVAVLVMDATPLR